MDDASAARAAALFHRGTELLQSGEAEAALPLLKRAHGLDPESIDVALNLSSAMILTKRFKRAVPLLEALTERAPENAMLWTNLGAAYLGNPVLARSEEQEKAIAAFKRAFEVDPMAPSVAYNIALVYRDRVDLDNAKQWFRKALQVNPLDRDARRILERLESGATR